MSLFRRKPPPPFLSVVIVAAGSASRMEGIDKQQVRIDEIPVVVRAISSFDECPMVAEIVVVCREDTIPVYYDLVREYGLDKVASVVKGGGERQESVFNGINACSEQAEYYAIHDGARPLVTPWEIDQCIRAAFEFGAAAVGTPVKDTIKVCGGDGFVTATPDRTELRAIQTPQIFAAGIYREAMELALRERRAYTDDCQLVEKAGHRVFISPGSYENIKITTPEDIVLAQAILAFREGGMEPWQI